MNVAEKEIAVNMGQLNKEDEEAVAVVPEVDSSSDEDLKKNEEEMEEEEIDPVELYPVREFHINIFKDPISFNPLVSGIGCLALWGLSIWCMVDPAGAREQLIEWRTSVSLMFTWLYMGSKAIFFFFLLYVVVRFGNVKLGAKDEPPEFSTPAYFAMIFAAGVAVGLFVYGVAEPLYYLDSHWYANPGYRSEDEVAMFAINLTITNWGVNGWAPYLVVAVCMALAGFRFKLPMTFRSCFYPILGDYTWGWVGDLIDGVSIVVTVAGVCTSLGLGAIQIVAGFQFLGWVDEDISSERSTMIQNLTIWGITCIATASVISGLDAGIKFLSLLAFMLGLLLQFLVFTMDDSKFLMNLIVQETGYFLQNSVAQLNFWTDAFGQLRPGNGRAIDGGASPTWFMDAWVVFYQAWWVSWSAFVGLFVARISRGRRIYEVIVYSMAVPIMYSIFWFCIWGGTGLRQHRQAREMEVLGETLFGNSTHFLVDGSKNCYDVPQESLFNDEGEKVFENFLLGVTPVCQFDSDKATDSSYNVLYSFSFPDTFDGEGLGPMLTILFIISLSIYFATSSDSGSLIVDFLASNGRLHHHWVQRLFWAVTEGAVATALLTAGGSDALAAVQAASIISGLPLCVMLCYMMQSIYCFCLQAESSDAIDFYKKPVQPEFPMPIYGGIFNMFEYIASLGEVHEERVAKGMDRPKSVQVIYFFKGIFVPGLCMWEVLSAAYPRNTSSNVFVTGIYSTLYYLWIALFACLRNKGGLLGWGWAVFFATATILMSIRNGFRSRFNLRSNELADFITSAFFWPQVFAQMKQYCDEAGLPNNDNQD